MTRKAPDLACRETSRGLSGFEENVRPGVFCTLWHVAAFLGDSTPLKKRRHAKCRVFSANRTRIPLETSRRATAQNEPRQTASAKAAVSTEDAKEAYPSVQKRLPYLLGSSSSGRQNASRAEDTNCDVFGAKSGRQNEKTDQVGFFVCARNNAVRWPPHIRHPALSAAALNRLRRCQGKAQARWPHHGGMKANGRAANLRPADFETMHLGVSCATR